METTQIVQDEPLLKERPGDTGNFDEEQYNQYLLGTDGPRKRVEYSKVTLGDDQEDDLSSFEVREEPRRV